MLLMVASIRGSYGVWRFPTVPAEEPRFNRRTRFGEVRRFGGFFCFYLGILLRFRVGEALSAVGQTFLFAISDRLKNGKQECLPHGDIAVVSTST